MRIRLGAAAACAAAALVACSPAEPPRPSPEQDLSAIAAFNERYLGAINDGDIETLGSLTTDGHIMLAPNRAPVVGKAANDALNRSAFERFDFDETWTPEETVVTGDFAYQRGTFVVRAAPKDPSGSALAVSGAFLRIYQRQPNGEWRMIRDMFNSDGTSGVGSE